MDLWVDCRQTFPYPVTEELPVSRELLRSHQFRAELASKNVVVPHSYLASPIVDGHPPVWPDSIEVTTPGQARNVVDDQQKKGADFIKVYIAGFHISVLPSSRFTFMVQGVSMSA